MVKLLQPGRVVIVLRGRRSGKKGIIVHSSDSSNKMRPYSYCLVAGIEKPPKKVHKAMSKKKVEKRLKIKAFVKYINVKHLMPTRYIVSGGLDPKALVKDEQMDNIESRKHARKAIQKVFEEKLTQVEFDKSSKGIRDIIFLKKKLRF
ncbi:large subunit ribosomal protein L27e [Babesia microti strain RI]|uniref:Large subunit ribosomal protein L27e n=1 Tax=Babesia microti (strain RI) TaxID=1133968 RepID=I7J8J9_BABMR|nr:large subunit ribosomal protein L27e [Babesia microti strain RI]CCF72899.1 large subunit ribosomal protein L27e [Babesia microti strain RI]|eukprot:XP_012647508.1 large subunit ribosomal protein L27e [Babesia microti strain RI]